MARFLARRLEGLVQSDIRRMTRECERLGGINLGQGICDLPTPPLVRDGAIEAIRQRKSTYSFPEGTRELREAIAEKLARDNGITADPRCEVVVTNGATGGYACALTALLNPGDGLLLFEPYYGYHLNAAIVAGLEPQYMELQAPGFHIREDALRAAVRPNTRAVVVCTPCNPSGKMFDEGDLRALAAVAEERDLLVITDEIYEYLRYDGRRHLSPATVPGLKDRTVTIMGLSKTFSITGWRLGYAVAPEPMARAMTLVNDLYYVCAPTPLQHGAADGFRAPESYFRSLQTDYQRRRDIMCEALDASGMPPIVPEGAYYVLADIGKLGFPTARDAAMALLERSGVAAVPGSAFFRGTAGDRLLRFCFAKEDDVLEEACRRIRKASMKAA
jgi:aminotransferase